MKGFLFLKGFFVRQQPRSTPRNWLIAGLGGLIAIGLTGAATAISGTPLIMASFGGSCVLLFSAPSSPFSQPPNVIGGHMVATAIGLVIHATFPGHLWVAALGVGTAIAVMAALRVTHPPAGADPFIVLADDPHAAYLLFPVLLGSIILVGTATIYHQLTGTNYPARAVEE